MCEWDTQGLWDTIQRLSLGMWAWKYSMKKAGTYFQYKQKYFQI